MSGCIFLCTHSFFIPHARIHRECFSNPSLYSPFDGMGNYCKSFHIVIQSEAKDLDYIEPCMFPRPFLPTVVWTK